MREDRHFKPFIPAEQSPPELTVTSVVLGILLAVLFGAANAYLGLRVGLTVSASIPAAVLSMGIIRVILRRDSVLENNMVQTIGSAGESVAAGAIFTLPALFVWMRQWGEGRPSMTEIAVIALCGGVLGVLFMVPLRRALIVQEHGVLPYPEGQACAEVLLAAETGGKAGVVFAGLGVAGVFKFLADGLRLFPSRVHWELKGYRGAGLGADVLPALLGVGYICGPRISSYMFSGGVLSWLVLMPLIALFAGGNTLFPGTVPVSQMDSFGIWSNYIKYIGAGAVAAGGILSLLKSLPLIVKTFGSAVRGLGRGGGINTARTQRDLPLGAIGIGVLGAALLLWLFPAVPVNWLGALIVVVFGFFFATVASRLVGLVGSSNSPVSGMTIATLLIATLLLKAFGLTGRAGMTGAIAIGSVICIVTAVSGDTSQDLKTGYILGATPRRQQIGELIGVAVSAASIGAVLFLLDKAWGYDTPELPAPQAMLMKLVVEGVMDGNLPWTLVFAGAGVAIVGEIMGFPVLPFAVGLYLPLHLSAPIMLGGLLRLILDKRGEEDPIQRGVLYTSGLIAGEGLIGILLAVFAILPAGAGTVDELINLSGRFSFGVPGAVVAFALLCASVPAVALAGRKRK